MVDLSTMSDAELMQALAASRAQSAPPPVPQADSSGVALTMRSPAQAQSFQQQTAAPADYGPPMPDQQSVPMPVSSGGFSIATAPPAPRPSAQQSASSGKSPSEMSDDELMSALAQSRQRDQGGIMRNFGAGADSALYDTLGAPVDAANWFLGNVKKQFTTNPFDREANATPAQPLVAEPFGGSRNIAHMFGAAGVPDPESIPANTTGEKIARGVGAGAGFAIAPEAALAGLTRAGIVGPQATEALGHIFGRAESLGSMTGNAVAGATGGGTAAAAEEMVPDQYKPIAGTIGGLIGGAAGAAAASAPRAAGTGARVVGEALDPFTAGGQQRAAGRVIRDAASNPELVRSDQEPAFSSLILAIKRPIINEIAALRRVPSDFSNSIHEHFIEQRDSFLDEMREVVQEAEKGNVSDDLVQERYFLIESIRSLIPTDENNLSSVDFAGAGEMNVSTVGVSSKAGNKIETAFRRAHGATREIAGKIEITNAPSNYFVMITNTMRQINCAVDPSIYRKLEKNPAFRNGALVWVKGDLYRRTRRDWLKVEGEPRIQAASAN